MSWMWRLDERAEKDGAGVDIHLDTVVAVVGLTETRNLNKRGGQRRRTIARRTGREKGERQINSHACAASSNSSIPIPSVVG